ncbi:MAG: RnfH family protein [Marinovum algicola]|uniref:RnfH family protein n=1 Tax=Marinovum algicola TaxID=42444 RepID=UPI0032EF669D
MTAEAPLWVEVAYALPEAQTVIELTLPAGATVADALRSAAAQPPFSGLDLDAMAVGIFGDRVSRDHALTEGDRVEVYRPLRVDPREARRRRAQARRG